MRYINCLWVILILLLATACSKTWDRGWEDTTLVVETYESGQPDKTPSYQQIEKALLVAETQEDVLALIKQCEERIAAGDADSVTYGMLGMLRTLMGAAYADSDSEKADYYISAMQACEKGMGLQPVFVDAINEEKSFEAAIMQLGLDDMEVMFFWNTAMQYYFKECLTIIEYPFNVNWMERSKGIQAHMSNLEPDWGHGALHFSDAIMLLGLPESMGGDMSKSYALLEESIKRWPNSILFRWGRAKYWCTKAGNKELFVKDLQWVSKQTPGQSQQPARPWDVHFINDAKAMLADVDEYF